MPVTKTTSRSRATRKNSPRSCAAASALEVVGEKWALLALREVFLEVRRFDRIVANTGAPRDVMAKRLKKLVDDGLLDRVRYSDRPERFEYQLTRSGADILPVLLTLTQWGEKYAVADASAESSWSHECGSQLKFDLTCLHCHKSVDQHSVIYEPGHL